MRRLGRRPAAAAGILTLVTAVTAACSSSPAGSAAPGSAASPSATASQPAGSDPALLSGPTRYPFTFTQPDGTKVTVKSPPTRVVAIDDPMFDVEELAALGVQPVGFQVYPQSYGLHKGDFDSRGVPAVISGQIKSFTSVGDPSGYPDLETVVSLRPDLIVGTYGTADQDKKLEAIAPLADYEETKGGPGSGIESLPWYPNLRLYAQILNRTAQFNAFITRFEAAVAAVRPALAGKTVRLVNPAPATATVFGPNIYESNLLRYAGLTVPPIPGGGKSFSFGPPGDNSTSLSLERAGELTGQYLMVTGGGSSAAMAQAFLANPVVRKLPSVRAGRAIVTGAGTLLGDFPVDGLIDQLAAIPKLPRAFKEGSR